MGNKINIKQKGECLNLISINGFSSDWLVALADLKERLGEKAEAEPQTRFQSF